MARSTGWYGGGSETARDKGKSTESKQIVTGSWVLRERDLKKVASETKCSGPRQVGKKVVNCQRGERRTDICFGHAQHFLSYRNNNNFLACRHIRNKYQKKKKKGGGEKQLAAISSLSKEEERKQPKEKGKRAQWIVLVRVERVLFLQGLLAALSFILNNSLPSGIGIVPAHFNLPMDTCQSRC